MSKFQTVPAVAAALVLIKRMSASANRDLMAKRHEVYGLAVRPDGRITVDGRAVDRFEAARCLAARCLAARREHGAEAVRERNRQAIISVVR